MEMDISILYDYMVVDISLLDPCTIAHDVLAPDMPETSWHASW